MAMVLVDDDVGLNGGQAIDKLEAARVSAGNRVERELNRTFEA